MNTQCKACSAYLTVPTKLFGRKIACPKCMKRIDTAALSPACECQFCFSEYKVRFDLVGKRLKCPACYKITRIALKSPRVNFECGSCSHNISVPQRMTGWTIKCPKCYDENRVIEPKEAAFLERAEEHDYLIVRDMDELVTGAPMVAKSSEPLNPHSRLAERQREASSQVIRAETMMTTRSDVRDILAEQTANPHIAKRLKKKNPPAKPPGSKDKDPKAPNRYESEIFDLSVSIVKSDDPPPPTRSLGEDSVEEISGSSIAALSQVVDTSLPPTQDLGDDSIAEFSDIALSEADVSEIRALAEEMPKKQTSKFKGEPPQESSSEVEPETPLEPESKTPVEPETPLPSTTTSQAGALQNTTVVPIMIVKSADSIPDLSAQVRESSSASGSLGISPASKTDGGLAKPPIPDPAVNRDSVPPELPKSQERTGKTKTDSKPPPIKFEKKTNSRLRSLLLVGSASLIAAVAALTVGSLVYIYIAQSRGGSTDKPPRRSRILRPGFEDKVNDPNAEYPEDAEPEVVNE